MTSTTATPAKPTPEANHGLGQPLAHRSAVMTPWAWVCIAVLAFLFVALHRTFIERMFRIATRADGDTYWEVFVSAATLDPGWDNDWAHILVIPFIAIAYIITRRRDLFQTPVRTWWPGLAIAIFGVFSYMFWVFPGRNDMFQGGSMMLALMGLVMFILGPAVMKVLWFPIAYLVFAIRVSPRVWNEITWSMQDLAANVATIILKLAGLLLNFETEKIGNTISITYMSNGQLVVNPLTVAEACAGLRMLMAFMALGVAIAFFSNKPMWQKLTLVALTAPIAIVVNVVRVASLGLLSLISPEFAKGDLHIIVGLLIMLPGAAVLLMFASWVLDRIFIREEPETEDEVDLLDEEPIRVHPSWGLGNHPWAGVQAWPQRLRIAGRLLVGVVGGALIMLMAGGAAMLMLGIVRPDVVEMLLPWAEGFEVWMASVLAPLAVLLGAAVVWALCRYQSRLSQADPGHAQGEANVSVPGGQVSRPTFAAAVVAGLLATAAMGFDSMIAAAQIVHFKAAVPLRDHLHLISTLERGWEMVGEDERLPAEIVEVLGTEEYLNRTYVRPADREAGIEQAAVRLHVAYYTGTPDTVPHVPERCITAGGAATGSTDRGRVMMLAGAQYYEQESQWWATTRMEPFAVRVPAPRFNVTTFTYTPTEARPSAALLSQQELPRANVFYFFVANGRFLTDPDEVRLRGFDPRDRHAYYCKVEVSVLGISDPDKAAVVANDFLSAMMPEILRVLPDWTDVVEGRWPENQSPE